MSIDPVSNFNIDQPYFLEGQTVQEIGAVLQNKIFELEKMIEAVNYALKPTEIVDLTTLVKTLTPSIVRINVEVSQNTLYNSGKRGSFLGTGFVISSDGFIATNFHVIDGAQKVEIVFNDQKPAIPAVVWGSDPGTDIAVLKIEGENFPSLSFTQNTAVGQPIISIGHPLGVKNLLTQGIVGATGVSFREAASMYAPLTTCGSYAEYILSDALSNPGNSGGPIFNLNGEVIGIHAFGRNGIAGHISSGTALRILDQLINDHFVTRSYIGASVCFIDNSFAKFLPSESKWGLVLTEITDGSPASMAGLQIGDIILEYDGIVPSTINNFYFDLASKSSCCLKIYRKGEVIDQECPLSSYKINMQTDVKRLCASFEELDGDKAFIYGYDSSIQGALVSRVDDLSILKPKWVVTGVCTELGEPISSIKNVEDLCRIIVGLEENSSGILEIRSPSRSSPMYIPFSV